MNDLTPEQSASLRAQLEVLRATYATKLREKVAQIEEGWETFLSEPEGPNRREMLSVLHRQTHTLAGSGATFGFAAAGEAARRAEIILKSLIQSGAALEPEHRDEIQRALNDLRRLSEPDGQVDEKTEAETVSAAGETEGPEEELRSRRLIYLFTDSESEPVWAEALPAFGFETRIYFTPLDLWEAARSEIPAAIVADCQKRPVEITHEGLPLSGALSAIHKESEQPVPIVWACRQDDLFTRIQAVRLGGSAFLPHPVDVDSLLVKLNDLTAHTAPEPFRVLVVDDEPALSRLYSLILRQAGMNTLAVTDPMLVMEPLVEFRPDLILMDVHMPGCSGIELAAVIRQQEAYVGIPIVFLSVERDITQQLEAMRQGGDDFLLKPLQPRHLVSAITTRALRARALHNLMHNDSLTGLLDHSHVKDRLTVELDRARRMGHQVSVAIIDVDNIAELNMLYGHGTGDGVLKSLSRLLTSRLRQTDVLGRNAGDSFLLVMHNSDGRSAKRVLDGIRATFASIPHRHDNNEFRVTFSAGVATSPPYVNVTDICEAAERALQRAKHGGRNRIEIIDEEHLWTQRGPLA